MRVKLYATSRLVWAGNSTPHHKAETMMRFLATCLLALIIPLGSHAQTTSADVVALADQTKQQVAWGDVSLRDLLLREDVLAASVKEIATVNPRVADALARSLADCAGTLYADETRRAYCDRARRYVVIVSRPGGALGFLMRSVEANTILLEIKMLSEVQAGDVVTRLAVIGRDWTNAVRSRLEILDKERQ